MAAGGARIRISPLARKTAAKLGVDVSGIVGSGPSGRIRQQDVLAAAKAPKAAAPVAAEPAPAAPRAEPPRPAAAARATLRRPVSPLPLN